MKTPITEQQSVVIYCEPWKDGYRSKTENGKLKATSTGSELSAAWNLAARFFFGGNTKAFIGKEERRALHVAQRGITGRCFVAWLANLETRPTNQNERTK
jgi:hypothetical protein